MEDSAGLMVRDYAAELAERLREASELASKGDDFERGRKEGFQNALAMLIGFATTFDIPLTYLGLDRARHQDFS